VRPLPAAWLIPTKCAWLFAIAAECVSTQGTTHLLSSLLQLFVLAEAVDELPRRPRGLPACPKTCTQNAAPWSKPFVQEKFGKSGFELP